MRLVPVLAAGLILCAGSSAFAQEWIEFASRDDRFTCNFPSQPTVTTSTYKSEYGADLPARVYTADQGASRYSMTVVDYADLERLLTEKSKSCPAGAETCKGGGATGLGYWKVDLQGAIVFASWKFMQRDVKLTHYMWNFMDLVEGHQLQLTSNRDKSRTFVSIYFHENRLHIMEATVPAGYPEPGFFQQSLGWLDENGNGIRYASVYIHGGAKPPLARRGGQGGQAGQGAPGAAAPVAGGQTR
jgi:hypothetical protein